MPAATKPTITAGPAPGTMLPRILWLPRRCWTCDTPMGGHDDTCRARREPTAAEHAAGIAVAADGTIECRARHRGDPIRCPYCMAISRFDETGALACPRGCVLAPPPRGYVDTSVPIPRRPGHDDDDRNAEYGPPGPGECKRALPYAGWELLVMGKVTKDADYIAGQWGHGGLLTAEWDHFTQPTSRLALTWGMPTDPGEEAFSARGADFMSTKKASMKRCEEMSASLDDFAASVQGDPALPSRKGNHGTVPSGCWLQCVVAAVAASPTWWDVVASPEQWERALTKDKAPREPSPLHVSHVSAIEAAQLWRDALGAFDAERHPDIVYEVGGYLAKVLLNSIVDRGGQYRAHTEHVSYAEQKTTSFSSYRAAMTFAMYTQIGKLGIGNPMASLGAAEFKNKMPTGIAFGKMAAHPTHNRSADAKNINQINLANDTWACIAAARVGGVWSPADQCAECGHVNSESRIADAFRCVTCGAATATRRTCRGGRPVTGPEMELVRRCDVGSETEIKTGHGKVEKDFKRVAVLVAVDEIRSEAVRVSRTSTYRTREQRLVNVDDATDVITQSATTSTPQDARNVAEWERVRHITTEEAKVALAGARRALREALVAWGLVPAEEAATKKRKRVRAEDGDVSESAVGRRARDTWQTDTREAVVA